MQQKISVTILTKNSSETIQSTLDALKDFDEVVILDTGSLDTTKEICSKYLNVKIYSEDFKGFGPTHNRASALASHPWILSIDSDEIVSDELKKEIADLTLNPKTAYEIRRHNYFQNRRMKSCSGWDPDYVVRLYHKERTSFSSDMVHEKVITKGLSISRLKGVIRHTPYRQISDFLAKMQSYSSLFAEQKASIKSSSLSKAILHGYIAFIKSYIFKCGFMQGSQGFIISQYNAHATYYKYLKLAEKSKH